MRNIAQRHKLILEAISRDGFVKVHELSRELDVSEVTIRKDLKELESRKMLYRNHGSASSISPLIHEMHIDEKEGIMREEKSRIAAKAAQLVGEGDKIVIASGTTVLAFAAEMPRDRNVTVITASVKVSLSLCYRPNIEIFQLGGTMRRSSVSVVGQYADDMLDGLSCNKLFIGVDGLDLDNGLTTSDIGESRINRKMIDICQEIIVLTDSSKFGKRGFSKICDLDNVHKIITDRNAPASMVQMIRERGVEVILV